MSSVTAIIPARMASTRFPGKPLMKICGLPMIEHVRRRVLLCDFLSCVIVATCDREIAQEVERFGGKVVMTSDRHESCVDRVAEAAQNVSADIIVNVQGDMPLVAPESLELLIAPLLNEDTVMFTDMMGAIVREEEFFSPDIVKVVVDKTGNALYYSREPIPSSKKGGHNGTLPRYKEFGINAYRYSSLFDFTRLSRTPLEKLESIDMLRLLENGFQVRMVSSSVPIVSVDTKEHLRLAEQMMEQDALFCEYGKGKNENSYKI